MTSVDEFPNTNPCCKIDAWDVDAYFDLQLTPADSVVLTLDNSWGPTSVDLAPAIKAGETITHLKLTDSALQYEREDYGRTGAENGGVDCISGDNLSKIISMKYLKDVGGNALTNGDVYMFNSNFDQFQPYNLQTFIDQTNATLEDAKAQISELQNSLDNTGSRIDGVVTDYTNKIDNLQTQVTANTNAITALQTAFDDYKTATDTRLAAIEAVVAKPSYVPEDAVITWGNVDVELDSNPTGKGIYAHDPNANVVGDMRFQ